MLIYYLILNESTVRNGWGDTVLSVSLRTKQRLKTILHYCKAIHHFWLKTHTTYQGEKYIPIKQEVCGLNIFNINFAELYRLLYWTTDCPFPNLKLDTSK